MSPRNDLSGAAPLFAALGDETRLALVARLCAAGPSSATQLATGADVTRQAITKHLRVLAGAGLINDARRGRERIWELDLGRFEVARRFLDQISRRWDERLERLKKLVEE